MLLSVVQHIQRLVLLREFLLWSELEDRAFRVKLLAVQNGSLVLHGDSVGPILAGFIVTQINLRWVLNALATKRRL